MGHVFRAVPGDSGGTRQLSARTGALCDAQSVACADGAAARLEKWPWSSYPATCGQAPVPDWSQTDWILAQFGRQRASAIRKYVAFVHEGARLPGAGTQLLGQLIPDRNTSSARCRRCGTSSASIRVTRRWRVRIGPAGTPWRRISGCTARRSEQNGEPVRGIRTLRSMAPDVHAFFCKRKVR